MRNTKLNLCRGVIVLLFISLRASAQQPNWTQQYPDVKERLTAMAKYGKDLIKRQQYDQAAGLFNQCVKLSQQASLDSFTTWDLILLGTAYRFRAHYDSAFYYFGQARRIAVEKKLIGLQASIQIESYTIFNRLGKQDSSDAVIGRMKELIPELDSNSSERAKIEMYMGHNDKHRARYTEALDHYYKSLRIATYLKDSANEGSIYVSLANVLVLLGQSDKALSYHQLAANLFTRTGRKFELVNEYLNMADLYITSSQLDSGELYVRKALPIIEILKDKSYFSNAYLDLGYIYARRKRFEESKGYFLQAIGYCQAVSNDVALMDAYQGMAEMYMADHKPTLAQPYIEKHLLLARQENNKEEVMEATWDLAENEDALHHYQKAYEFLKIYATSKDSAYTESSAKSMAEMESKYQAEKKEKEIALLKKDQQLDRLNLQKQKNFQLVAVIFLVLLFLIAFLMVNRYRIIQRARRLIDMERMRNTIARDLHDDIGSTLTSINILSKVALRQQAEHDNPMETSMIKIKDRSSAIMESMSDIVWAINPRHDTIELMIFRIKEFAAEILEPLNINYAFQQEGNFSAVKLDMEKRRDFYLLCKEAINNAAKYSGCCNLIIHLKQEQRWLRLEIRDDGIGFNESEIKNGNGLVNMRGRASSMNAGIRIESSTGNGTTINVDVPIT
jgi:two-component system, NarL family, sensor histidine kinase UhpB